ncbi:MAG: 4-alpha-glucanotransferase [Deltaproteobacteria bacterium]|nr:4-alpha-glucanotransferase [Deltaproteobacteria bacterium]
MSALIDAALAELGVTRLLLAIHDLSFPSDADEDVGRGSPSTRGAQRLFAFARELGFTGIQLGPQGQTSRGNPSPYDGTIFSRHIGSIALRSLRPTGPFAGLVGDPTLDAAVLPEARGPAQHRRAYDITEAILDEAYASLRRGTRPDLTTAVAAFRSDHASWLHRDALFSAMCASQGGASFRSWPELDARLWHPRAGDEARSSDRIRELEAQHADAMERYALGQLLAHEEHAHVRTTCAAHDLVLYGDFQVGYSEADMWAHAAAFLEGYAMGAPPSRTNPAGQPWNYPVLDPDQLAGRARALLIARVDKAFGEYDSLRLDHPHGLVCPWVYRTATDDPGQAVVDGGRLFESPDLADYPDLARFAIARPEQLDRTSPRYGDRWVRELTEDQVTRYAALIEAIGQSAVRHGRSRDDLSCEVLSTMPLPLQRVLQRFNLGRWRVTQKADLDNPGDVYRTENAEPVDWVMLGNHDTAPVFALIKSWRDAKRSQWIAHLTQRLALPADTARSLAVNPGLLATAMLAELFVCAAENVSIFFADLFGLEERFNVPGLVSDENWRLRLPADFEARYARGRETDAVLDIPLALALALEARSSTSGLAALLRD